MKALACNCALISAFFASACFAVEPGWQELGLMQGYPAAKDKRVNDTNWTLYPNNRWGFLNVQRIHPTAMLTNGTPVAWEETPEEVGQFAVETSGQQPLSFDVLLEEYNTDAVVVIHKGKLVYERYWNGMDPQRPHWMASTSKSLVGTAAGILIHQGAVKPDARVKTYIPELAASGFADVTVDQLLDMTGGTHWDESMAALMDTKSFARQYGAAAGSWRIPGVESSGVYDFLPSVQQIRPHGESFVYNTPQVDVLGWVLSRATGKPLERILSESFWTALGAESPAYYMLDTAGIPWATGGLSVSARDLAKFGQLMLDKGSYKQRQLIPAAVVEDIQYNANPDAFAKGSHADLYPEGAYRKYWWLKNNDDGVYLAKGIFGQYIYINPAKNVVIVRFASEKVSADRTRMKRIEAAFDKVAAQLHK